MTADLDLTYAEAWDLLTYFNVADEISDLFARTFGPPITLEEIDPSDVEAARRASTKHVLPWPPYLPEAEEFFLDHGKQIKKIIDEGDG